MQRFHPTFYLVPCLLLVAAVLHAQDLVIELDAVTGSASFFERSVGSEQPVTDATVSYGANVILRIRNVNGTVQYVTNKTRTSAIVTTGMKADGIRDRSGAAPATMPAGGSVAGMGQGTAAGGLNQPRNLQELKDLVNNLQISDKRNDIWSNRQVKRVRNKRGRIVTTVVEDPSAKQIADNTIELLKIINDEYQCYVDKASEFLRGQAVALQGVESAQFQLRTVLNDDARPENELKSMSNQIVASLLGTPPPSGGGISRETLLNRRSLRLNELMSSYREAEACYRKFAGAKQGLETVVRANPQIVSKVMQVAAVKVEQFVWLLDNAMLDGDIENCRKAVMQLESHLTARYDTVSWLYEKIWAATYTQEIVIPAREDRVDVDITLNSRAPDAVRSISSSADDVGRTFKYSVPVTGGLKFSASAGTAFAYYFNRQFGFTNRDSIIVRDSTNLVLPGIAALIHLQARTASSVTYGMSFGISWAVLTDRRLSFIVGPSLFFGENDKLVLTAGAALGEVERLDKGRQLGDKLESETAAVPIQKGYAPGAFAAITYNF